MNYWQEKVFRQKRDEKAAALQLLLVTIIWIVFQLTPKTSLHVVKFMVDVENVGFNVGFYKYFQYAILCSLLTERSLDIIK